MIQARSNAQLASDAPSRPVYLITDAARYLHLPLETARSWVLGRPYATSRGRRRSAPLIKLADSQRRLLSFLNLVELHVLSAIRRSHRVKLSAVRRAIRYLHERLNSAHPLLDHELLTDGANLFIERYSHYVNVSESGQMHMRQALTESLKRISRDEHGTPITLFPFTRPNVEASPTLIAIDPRIRSGQPCIAGTTLPTRIVAERHRAGESIDFLAGDYGRPREEIEEALRYESGIAA